VTCVTKLLPFRHAPDMERTGQAFCYTVSACLAPVTLRSTMLTGVPPSLALCETEEGLFGHGVWTRAAGGIPSTTCLSACGFSCHPVQLEGLPTSSEGGPWTFAYCFAFAGRASRAENVRRLRTRRAADCGTPATLLNGSGTVACGGGRDSALPCGAREAVPSPRSLSCFPSTAQISLGLVLCRVHNASLSKQGLLCAHLMPFCLLPPCCFLLKDRRALSMLPVKDACLPFYWEVPAGRSKRLDSLSTTYSHFNIFICLLLPLILTPTMTLGLPSATCRGGPHLACGFG